MHIRGLDERMQVSDSNVSKFAGPYTCDSDGAIETEWSQVYIYHIM